MKQLILIAGGSCSGKGVVAEVMQKALAEREKLFEIISMDDYYVDVPLNIENRSKLNHDVPEAIEWLLLTNQVNLLTHGKYVYKPKYSFEKKAKYRWEWFDLAEKDGLIIEGLYALHQNLTSKFDNAIRLFVDADEEVRYARRSARQREGGEEKLLEWRWKNQVIPAYNEQILPTKANAHHIIDNKYINWDNITTPNTEPLRLEIEKILQELKLI